MTEAGMVALVEAALGRPCAGQVDLNGLNHGNVCPPKWHTWRRRTAPGAAGFNLELDAAFVGEDLGNQAGTLKINLVDAATCNAMIAEAGLAGYQDTHEFDDSRAPFRAVVRRTVVPGDAELAFYTHWIQQARHE